MAVTAAHLSLDPGLAGSASLRAEFFRVFNLRSIGWVLGLCVLSVASRWIGIAYAEPAEKWVVSGLKFLRQNAISGITMLTAVAFLRTPWT